MTNYKENRRLEHKGKTTRNPTGYIVGGVVAIAAVAGLILLTDIDLTETGSLPTVSVDAGEMPEINVDVADISVGTKTMEVEVPTVDIELPKEGQEADDLTDNMNVDIEVGVEPDQ